MSSSAPTHPLDMSGIFRSWWPLALSWLLMGIELPMIAGVVARLPDQEIQLAAFGGVVFPLSLMIEAPVIMMLAASTALSTNHAAFTVLRRFMVRLAATMTSLHVLIAFTPVYDWVVVPLLDIPADVVGPARIGLMITTPWTWSIADRRFHQGMLIRFNHRSAVAIGTGVRLLTTCSMLLVGWFLLDVPGVVVAAGSLVIGTFSETVYVRLRSRSVVRGPLREHPVNDKVTSGMGLLKFYIPLAMTPLLVLTMQPIGTAGIDRMPNAMVSLAVWAPLNGLVFMCRSVGVAYNEVVIGHCAEEGSHRSLRRFAWLFGGIFTALLAIVSFTPLSVLWFEHVMGLDPELVALSSSTIWIAALIPLLTFLQSLYQGILVSVHRTRYITESVVLYLFVTLGCIIAGVYIEPEYGVTAVLVAHTAGNLVQAGWLWHRCRPFFTSAPRAGSSAGS